MDLLTPTFAILSVPALNLLVEPGEVAVTPARVCNHVIDVAGMFTNDGIVNDTPVLVEQDRECGAKFWE
jgi:hypothetical protein